MEEDNTDSEDTRKATSGHEYHFKPHSTPLTLQWLEENYESAEGVCIPRSTLYFHYLDFCQHNHTNPVNAASFGKIIRQQFPQITTRRLGTRGQSKYHYYGIGVRESSVYFDVMYSAKSVAMCCEGKKDAVKQVVTYSPRSKLGTLLPNFPDVRTLVLPSEVEEDKVSTFLVMYRTHCQRILDTVIRANFDEIRNFILHFWQGMPTHMVPVLAQDTLVKLVGVCDTILYKAMAQVLMPSVHQAIPESLTQVIRKFSRQLEEWLKSALFGFPDTLQRMKLNLSRQFCQVLRRQNSLSHLVQAARTVVSSPDVMAQMHNDWLAVDLPSIVKQTMYTMDNNSQRVFALICRLTHEFERLLEEHSPMESYIEWLDGMVTACVLTPRNKNPGLLKQLARQFLLMWSCFGTRVIRDMTLHSAPSFGSFHLLHMMFDEYVLYQIEALHTEERGNELLSALRGVEPLGASEDENMILPEPAFYKETRTATFPDYTSQQGQCVDQSYNATLNGGHDCYEYESNSDCSSGSDDSFEQTDSLPTTTTTKYPNGSQNLCTPCGRYPGSMSQPEPRELYRNMSHGEYSQQQYSTVFDISYNGDKTSTHLRPGGTTYWQDPACGTSGINPFQHEESYQQNHPRMPCQQDRSLHTSMTSGYSYPNGHFDVTYYHHHPDTHSSANNYNFPLLNVVENSNYHSVYNDGEAGLFAGCQAETKRSMNVPPQTDSNLVVPTLEQATSYTG